MYHFRYVTAKEAKPYRNNIINLTNELQDRVRERFTFQFHFIGSSSRNMITYDTKSNIGFDFDINYSINDEEVIYGPDVNAIIKVDQNLGPLPQWGNFT